MKDSLRRFAQCIFFLITFTQVFSGDFDNMKRYFTGIGQDSHRFESDNSTKTCTLGDVEFEGVPGMDADSDGDVILHAICNAITSVTHVPILGKVAIDMCHKENIKDSSKYLEKALETLQNIQIEHVALTLEGKRPKFQKKALEIRQSVASLMNIEVNSVGITFTSGDGLTSFGRGEGLMCYALVSFSQ